MNYTKKRSKIQEDSSKFRNPEASSPRVRPSRQDLHFSVPAALDLAELFPDPRQRECAAYLLHITHWRWITWRADDWGWVPLKREYLTKVVPKAGFTAIRKRLVDAGVIEWDRHYVEGEHSQLYRLCPHFRTTVRRPCRDGHVAKKIRKMLAQKEQRLRDIHLQLRDDLRRLDFNWQRASEIIATLTPKPRDPEDPPRKGPPPTAEEFRELVTEGCKRFDRRDGLLSVDRFGRVHSPITCMPKELRACLSVGGRPLVSIDLACSQPLLAGVVAERFRGDKDVRRRMLTADFNDGRTNPYRRVKWNPQPPRKTTTYGNSGIVLGGPPPGGGLPGCLLDDAYRDLCLAGRLYDHLQSETGYSRDATKRSFYREILFGTGRKPSRLRGRFEQDFPGMAGAIRSLKRHEYQRPAWLLQNLEATVFIWHVCRRIKRERPGVPVITVHDACLTTSEHAEYVRDVVLETFQSLFGLTPTLHVEHCDG